MPTIKILGALVCLLITCACPSGAKPADSTNSTNSANSANILTLQAKRLNDLVESEEAVALCNRAINLNKNLGDAYIERARAYSALGKVEEAFADLNTAIKDKNSRMEALKERARMNFALKNYQRTIDDLSCSLQGKGSGSQLLLRARAYAAMHKPSLAAADLTESLRQHPHEYDVLFFRSEMYLLDGHLDKALTDCNELINQDKATDDCLGNSKLFERRSQIYKLLGKSSLAALDATRAKQLENAAFDNSPFRSNKNRFK